MNEQDTGVKRRRRRDAADMGPQPRWPSDPESVEASAVDFEAIAHVLANSCRWGGHTRRYISLAQHALTASEEIEALDGIAGEDRRALALHALLADAGAAWLGDAEGEHPVSARAAARKRTHGARIDRAVLEAAGLDPEPPEEWTEALRFVDRMTDAAERRDLGIGAGGFPFPPLRRTIRPLAPEAAAERWLARFHELHAGGAGAAGDGAAAPADADASAGGEHAS